MIPDEDQKFYAEWVAELHNDFRAKNLRIYVNVQAGADDATMRHLAQASDGIILMNYDEHEETTDPGPVASEPWFEGNLQRVLTRFAPGSQVVAQSIFLRPGCRNRSTSSASILSASAARPVSAIRVPWRRKSRKPSTTMAL